MSDGFLFKIIFYADTFYETLPKPIEQIQCCVSVRERWAFALEALHTTIKYKSSNDYGK